MGFGIVWEISINFLVILYHLLYHFNGEFGLLWNTIHELNFTELKSFFRILKYSKTKFSCKIIGWWQVILFLIL